MEYEYALLLKYAQMMQAVYQESKVYPYSVVPYNASPYSALPYHAFPYKANINARYLPEKLDVNTFITGKIPDKTKEEANKNKQSPQIPHKTYAIKSKKAHTSDKRKYKEIATESNVKQAHKYFAMEPKISPQQQVQPAMPMCISQPEPPAAAAKEMTTAPHSIQEPKFQQQTLDQHLYQQYLLLKQMSRQNMYPPEYQQQQQLLFYTEMLRSQMAVMELSNFLETNDLLPEAFPKDTEDLCLLELSP